MWRQATLGAALLAGCKPAGPEFVECRADSDCDPGHRCNPELRSLATTGATTTGSTGEPPPVTGGFEGSSGSGSSSGTSGTWTTGIYASSGAVSTTFEEDFDLNSGYCDPMCEDRLCGPHEGCSSPTGKCRYVECAAHVACDRAGDYCNLSTHTCYPTSGACTVDADCPALLDHPEAETRCTGGFCTLHRASKVRPVFEELAPVSVESPAENQVFAGPESLQFSWISDYHASIGLVLSSAPATPLDLDTYAIWGVSASADEGMLVGRRWQDGHAIVDGVWAKDAGPVPSTDTLYFIVALFERGKLIAASVPVTFHPRAFAPSESSELCQTDEDCFHPEVYRVCRGLCVAACVSDVDCAPLGLGCGPGDSSPRLCL